MLPLTSKLLDDAFSKLFDAPKHLPCPSARCLAREAANGDHTPRTSCRSLCGSELIPLGPHRCCIGPDFTGRRNRTITELGRWRSGSRPTDHDRILIKTSFKKPLDAAPILQVGDQRVSGLRSDTRGLFWQFHAADLKPGTSYELSLTSSDGRSLSQPWMLSTMPAPDELPSKLRPLIIHALVATIFSAPLKQVSASYQLQSAKSCCAGAFHLLLTR